MTRQQQRESIEAVWRKYIGHLSSPDYKPRVIYVGIANLTKYRTARGWPAERAVVLDGVRVEA